jgi:hypothetical protein
MLRVVKLVNLDKSITPLPLLIEKSHRLTPVEKILSLTVNIELQLLTYSSLTELSKVIVFKLLQL